MSEPQQKTDTDRLYNESPAFYFPFSYSTETLEKAVKGKRLKTGDLFKFICNYCDSCREAVVEGIGDSMCPEYMVHGWPRIALQFDHDYSYGNHADDPYFQMPNVRDIEKKHLSMITPEFWGNLAKLHDILLGSIGVYLLPAEFLSACTTQVAGEYAVWEDRVFEYRGLHPAVYLHSPVITTYFMGAQRLAVSLLLGGKAGVLLDDRSLIRSARNAITNRSKRSATTVFERLRETMTSNFRGSSNPPVLPHHFNALDMIAKSPDTKVYSSPTKVSYNWPGTCKNLPDEMFWGFHDYASSVSRKKPGSRANKKTFPYY